MAKKSHKNLSDRELLEFVATEVVGLKDDVSILKDDVSTLKDDVSILKDDVSTLQIHMTNNRTDVVELKNDMKVVKDTLVEHTGMLVEMAADIKRLDEERLMIVHRQDRLEKKFA